MNVNTNQSHPATAQSQPDNHSHGKCKNSVPRSSFYKSSTTSHSLSFSPKHIKFNSQNSHPSNQWSQSSNRSSLPSSSTIFTERGSSSGYAGNIAEELYFPELGLSPNYQKPKKNKFLDLIIHQEDVGKLTKFINTEHTNLSVEEITACFEQLKTLQATHSSVMDSIAVNNLIDTFTSNYDKFTLKQNLRILRCKDVVNPEDKKAVDKIHFLFKKIFLNSTVNFKKFENNDILLFICHFCEYPYLTPYNKKEILEPAISELCLREDFNPTQIAQIVKLFADNDVLHLSLFAHLENLALNQKEKFTPNEIALLLWSYVYLGIESQNLLAEFSQVIVQEDFITSLPSADIVNILWSYIVFKPKATSLGFFKHLLEKDDGSSRIDLNQLRSDKYQNKLYQIYMACQALKIEDKISWPEGIWSMMSDYQPKEIHISELQSKITEIIRNLNLIKDPKKWKEEYLYGPFSIDLFLRKYSLAIEIDGPYHYVEKYHRYGSDALRDWILAENGFEIIRIPYYILPNNDAELQNMLFNTISNAIVGVLHKRRAAKNAAKKASSSASQQ